MISKARIRLDEWECRLLHQALGAFVEGSEWRNATDGCFYDLTQRLKLKLDQEAERARKRGGRP